MEKLYQSGNGGVLGMAGALRTKLRGHWGWGVDKDWEARAH